MSSARGRAVTWAEAADALARAFEETLNLQLRLRQLDGEEHRGAMELLSEKYGTAGWTNII